MERNLEALLTDLAMEQRERKERRDATANEDDLLILDAEIELAEDIYTRLNHIVTRSDEEEQ